MGDSVSTVYFNLRLRNATLDMPLIDYDLAFLFQPMLMLGISIGVAFNVMFADCMVTVLLIILFLGDQVWLENCSWPIVGFFGAALGSVGGVAGGGNACLDHLF
ncbi:uncharacterized protein Pyn_04877 [Prunus yedoensis var. nudiflora]|uniref:Uncharacterized protein n=1 Tax=Prunus yedoensis var. nudiflora TaxID=2094558 RepID=A0A314UVK5_PRUYE|nr:uncharacterized protein Pyn_04877 [Prunus yedoensis var. nudiflora]